MDPRPERHGIETPDGTPVPVRVYGRADGPVVLIVPAMGVRARAYGLAAATMADMGLVAVTMELRGHGDSAVRPSRRVDFGYQDLIAQDIRSACRWCRQQFAGRDLILLGHSLGGQLGALYAAAHPGDLDALVLVTACSVHFRGWPLPLNLGVLAGTQFARLVADAVGAFPGKTLRFAGVEARGVIRDWAANGRTGAYRLAHADTDYEAALGEVRLPILALSFEGDALAPRRACRNLLNKMGHAEITEVNLDRAALGAHGGHFGWLRSPTLVTGPLCDWLEERRP
jgi:predicted alpha/beta hydrolase